MESQPDPVQTPSSPASGGVDGTRLILSRITGPARRRRISSRAHPTHRPRPRAVLGMETDRDGFRSGEGHTD